ncbi:MAG TPA: hypothetical protein VII93_00240 [Anaerolineales bacterium]
MTNTQVRQNIPNDWSQKVTCPLCAVFKMQVVDPPNGPDQLRCDSCGISFELELGGDLIHVIEWPDGSTALQEDVAGRWISVEELRTLVRMLAIQQRAGMDASNPTHHVNEKLLAEISQTVESLHGLGNTPAQIGAILEENEPDPQRIEAAREAVNRLERTERELQAVRLRSSLILAGVLLILMIGVGIVLSSVFLGKPNGTVGSQQAPILPNLAKALHLGTPVIEPTTTPEGTTSVKVSGCPNSPAEAAAMFGGQVDKWSSPSSSGWVMLTTSQAATIFVPKNMSAGYLQFSNQLSLTQVNGPATLTNIYYVAISCRLR